MTVTSSSTVSDPSSTAPTSPPAGNRPRRRAVTRVLILVLVAWGVVVLACLVHAAVVLPVLLLVATASVLRGGQTLLDRLMLAVALLLGLTCAGALIFAVWPWGLDPVPVAGVAFTALIVIAAGAARRPALPRPRLSDLLSLGAAAALGALAARPMFGSDVDRLRRFMSGEDLARHADVFDSIRQTGGYLFEHEHAARAHVYDGMITYPQGSHMLDALLDGFVRSSGHQYGTGLDVMLHFMGFEAAWFGLLGLAMIWAVQWLAGRRAPLGRKIVLIVFSAMFCATAEPLALIYWGYPSELAGVVEVVLLVAVLARPLRRMRQQILIVASLTVAVGFTYYLFLPAAGLAVAVWLLRYRREVWRHRAFAVPVALVGAVLAVVPALLGLALGDQASALSTTGGNRESKVFLGVLGCLVVAGLIGRRALRSRIWRGYAACLGSVVALTLALEAEQRLGGAGGYYTSKSLHLVLVVLALGVGSLILYLPAPSRGLPVLRRIALLATAGVVAVAVAGGFVLIRSGTGTTRTVSSKTDWARIIERGRYGAATSRASGILQEYRAQLGGPAEPTLFLTDDPYESYQRTLFLGTLERTSGRLAPGFYDGDKVDAPDRLPDMVAAITGPIRIVATSEQALRQARQVKAQFPRRQIEVVRGS